MSKNYKFYYFIMIRTKTFRFLIKHNNFKFSTNLDNSQIINMDSLKDF